MSQKAGLTGLNIDSAFVKPAAPNFLPPTWPPTNDFPIVIDANGRVISRYGDSIWNLTPWAKKVVTLNFGDGRNHRDTPGISPENSSLLRLIVAWWLYGPRNIRKPRSLHNRFIVLRGIFTFCSQQGILASELMHYPKVAERLTEVIRPSVASRTITFLHEIWEERELLGMSLLDPAHLRNLSTQITKHEKSQTPYIPPRIWKYQLSRLRACLDDFNAHQKKIEECFHFCLSAYAKNAGSLAQACSKILKPSRRPFQAYHPRVNGAKTGLFFMEASDKQQYDSKSKSY